MKKLETQKNDTKDFIKYLEGYGTTLDIGVLMILGLLIEGPQVSILWKKVKEEEKRLHRKPNSKELMHLIVENCKESDRYQITEN